MYAHTIVFLNLYAKNTKQKLNVQKIKDTFTKSCVHDGINIEAFTTFQGKYVNIPTGESYMYLVIHWHL